MHKSAGKIVSVSQNFLRRKLDHLTEWCHTLCESNKGLNDWQTTRKNTKCLDAAPPELAMPKNMVV